MNLLGSICLCVLLFPWCANGSDVDAIIERARASIGSETALNRLVTLQLSGWIEPTDAQLPGAAILIIARKPCSQRMEVKINDLVETTILSGGSGCIIRSNLSDADKRSQMRVMSEAERQRVAFSTRQLFNFYLADVHNGERIRYGGIEQRRGLRCHKLLYAYSDDSFTTRYFTLNDNALISTVTDQGVESVEIGARVVAGIKFPQRIEYYQHNTRLHTIVLNTIKVNQPLQRGIFTIPTSNSTK